MSEYQYVEFRAIDRPLNDRELKFAESQSSRAEITRWSFTNEYHFGDFRGDAEQLLRGGYDVHLHYANFGIRKVMLRLPSGFPFLKSVWSQYVDGESVQWQKDKRGSGGILTICPFIEAGELEDIWDLDEYVDGFVQLRNELLEGDLRVLFSVWLSGVVAGDVDWDELRMPPVPAGIGKASPACQQLLDFYEIDPLILTAVDNDKLTCPPASDIHKMTQQWIADLPEKDVRSLLGRFLLDDMAQAKAETMTRVRETMDQPAWPVSNSDCTLQELLERTEQLRAEESAREKAKQEAAARREAKRQEQKRQQRMQQMVKNPKKWLTEADKLVEQRGTVNYKAAAEILADLGEAIGGSDGNEIVRTHAAHLVQKHPTLTRLKSSLRKRDLWP